MPLTCDSVMTCMDASAVARSSVRFRSVQRRWERPAAPILLPLRAPRARASRSESVCVRETDSVRDPERRGTARPHQAAVEGVAAYLADEDAVLYNLTDTAIKEDALAAALSLTALAADAVTALAAATGARAAPCRAFVVLSPTRDRSRMDHVAG